MHRVYGAMTVGLLGMALVACGEPASPGTSCRDISTLRPSVTVGSTVVFDWEPNCGVAFLIVDESGADDQWAVLTPEATWDNPDEANRLMPRVTYGQVPGGTTQLRPAAALMPGHVYEVVLWRIVPTEVLGRCLQRLQQACLVGVREFTR